MNVINVPDTEDVDGRYCGSNIETAEIVSSVTCEVK